MCLSEGTGACLSEGGEGVFIRKHTGCVYQRAYRVCLSKGSQGVFIRG